MLIGGMETLDGSYGSVLNKPTMEDSLFPYISDNFNQYITSGHDGPNHHTEQISPTATEHSDMEADMPHSQLDLTEVDVYTQLEHKERDLILAAELGKSLLEKNEELAAENERLSKEYHEKLEALEQEKHELRRRLKFKVSECDASSTQLNCDIRRAQEELEESKAMLASVEREKSRAVEELSQQNNKLLSQLHRAVEAEEQLSAQVQHLRKEFLERKTSTGVRILQLETENVEIEEDSKICAELASDCDVMKDEMGLLREELAIANENAHHLERQLHDKERELKRVAVELNDAHVSNRQLQVRIDELREEMSLQMSFNSQGNSSLLAELEQSGVNYNDLPSPVMSQYDKDDLDKESKSVLLDDMTSELTLRCYQSLLSGITGCHQQLFELKQEMWEVYQRIQSVCTVLRTFVKKCPTPEQGENGVQASEEHHMTHPMNLSVVLSELSSLVQEAITTKGSPDSHKIVLLNEKQETLMKERDVAVAAKNNLEVSLASAKVDLMAVNSQLLEAIQQKMQQQKELEAWQDDMEQMIQKALVDRHAMKRATIVRHAPPANQEQPPQRSWFSFRGGSRRSRQPTGEQSASPSSETPSTPTTPQTSQRQPPSPEQADKPGIFSSWLKRRQNPDSDGNAPS